LKFILERQWNLYIPGFSDEIRGFRKPILHSVHSSRQSIVSRSKHDSAAQARTQASPIESKSPPKDDSFQAEDDEMVLINSETIDRDL
jgi:transcription initiation factor TFIID subunit TAF12